MNSIRSSFDPKFKSIAPLSLYEFKGIAPTEKIHLPEIYAKRKFTDIIFLICFIICIVIMVVLTLYISSGADSKKVFNGIDSCGNICGINNTKRMTRKANCKPEDHRDYPISLYAKEKVKRNNSKEEKYRFVGNKCIKAEDCKGPDKKIIFRRCFPVLTKEDRNYDDLKSATYFYEILGDIPNCILIPILIMILMGVALCLLMFVCFRCNAFITFWSLLGIEIATFVIAALIFWGLYIFQNFTEWLVLASIPSVYLVILCALLYFLRKHIPLVVALYVETLEAIFRIRILLAVPLLTSLILFAVNGMLIYMILVAFSGEGQGAIGTLGFYYILFFAVMILWLYSFINGCQCMIVAGAIASYYFTRKKSDLQHPLLTSVLIMMRYHLGSIALGSLIITIFSIIRMIIENTIEDNTFFAAIMECCLEMFEEILEYVTKKAYIMTAVHGKNFCKSGIRAARLLWRFLLDTVAVDGLGYCAMHVASILIILGSLAAGFGLPLLMGIVTLGHLLPGIFLGMYLTGIVSFFYISLMNVSIETIFICFCEDKLLNDGSPNKPYFMSPPLLALLTDAVKLAEEEREKREREDARRQDSESS